ncbi:MAG: phosphoglycerate dehydrogenase [Treponema sp.]|nr:phosphoglycerate dehydrogenase [Treponema sp.]
MKILVTPTSLKPDSESPAMKRLQSFAKTMLFNPLGKPLSEDELIPLLQDCDGSLAGLDHFTARVIESAPSLKVISRYGIGVDNVDLAAAKAKGIKVCNTPGANAQAVADLVFALLLSIARRVPVLDRKTREGMWPRSIGVELYGKTLGILGLGAVGKAVAERAKGFSMKIMAYDPYINAEYARSHGISSAGFDSVIRESDFISLNLPLTKETQNIISKEVMKSMKKGAIIINTARGGLIDEAAAYDSLVSGHLGGLGLDTFEEEPPKKSPLFELDNVVLTPHTAAHTVEAISNMAEMSVMNLIDVLSGRDCPFIVN